MIQLTKGTNVLDINLSDFSGAGQDVVQNGSFNDIGSDLVENGDFAEIGSELVTNGDFSATPLGSEIVVNPNFVTDDISAWNIAGTPSRATKSWNASQFMRLTYDVAAGQALYDNLGHTLNAYYNVKMRVRGTKADGSTAQGSLFHSIGDLANIGVVISNPTLTSEWQDYEFNVWSTEVTFRFYLASAEIGDLVDFDSISVKENTNLVTNPNFSATGSELLSEGASPMTGSWGSNGTIIDGKLKKTASGIAYRTITYTEGNSYKAIIDVDSLDGATNFWLAGTNSANLVVGINTIYIVAGATAGYGAAINNGFSSGVGSVINSISVKELGEDWVSVDDTNAFGENGLTMTSTEGLDVKIYQANVISNSKSYKVTYTIHENGLTGTNAIQYYTGSALNGYDDLPDQSVGTHTFYYTAPSVANDRWYFRLDLRSSTSTTDFVTISSLVVQELGEDWTSADGDIDTYNENGVTITSINADNDNRLSQNSVTEDGKSYKVIYTIHDTSYSSGTVFQYYDGDNYISFPEQGVGTHTFYFTRVGTDDFWNFNLNASSSGSLTDFVTISSISVKEVGQDWTVGDGWTVEDNKAVCDGSLNKNINQNIGLITGKPYKIVFTVADYVSGNIDYNVGGNTRRGDIAANGTYTDYVVSDSGNFLFFQSDQTLGFVGSITNIIVQQLDTNNRWVTFADPDSKSVMKLGQVDLEIDSSGNNCGVYQTGLIKPNKLYIITINMKATAAIYVEIAASLGTAVSAVIGTELLTTSYKEYSFEYVTPFAVDHDLQIHRLFGSGANQTISIDYVSMNGVDESQWTNDPTWDPFATSLVFVPTLTDESTNNSKQFTLNTSITDGGWDGRSLHGQVIINEFPTEIPAAGVINLKQPDFLEGFYQVEIRGYLGTFYRVLGKCMAHLERTSTEDGYNRFESYNDTVTYKAYEE